jgi:hypothetical protein
MRAEDFVILFLDFDGVLHPAEVFKPARKPIELRAEGALMMHAHILEKIIQPFDVQIILSTSWVRSLGYLKTVKRMPPALAERVIGATWHTGMVDVVAYPYTSGSYTSDPFNFLTRFEQIRNYVIRHDVKSWLAIDDLHSGADPWPAEFESRLVKTDGEAGLGCEEKQREMKQKLEELKKA